MSTTRIRVDPDDPETFPKGKIDFTVVDSTTEDMIALQQEEDENEAMQDMARYTRRIRRRMGLTQVEFARRIHVSRETIRNWEQGKRCPTGAARALLRVLDKAPESALRIPDLAHECGAWYRAHFGETIVVDVQITSGAGNSRM